MNKKLTMFAARVLCALMMSASIASAQTWEAGVAAEVEAQAHLIHLAHAAGAPAHQPEALAALLDLVSREAAAGRRPVVMFDLDDTLVDTGYRQMRIIQEFAAQPDVQARFPQAARLMSGIEYRHLHYDLGDTLSALGVSDAAILRELTAFWLARFFDSRYLLLDQANPGGVDYVREMRRRGGIVVYLTGRWEEMRPGTEESMARMGYPPANGSDVFLMMKPDRRQTDIDFKNAAFSDVARLGEVVGGFENEPANVNAYEERFAGGIYIFLDTRHSTTTTVPAPGIFWVGDFRY